MLSFDCLADAISKASLLKEFCFGVRVIVNKDATVLYSSLPDIGEDCMPVIGIPATGDNRLDETRKKRERKLSFERNQAAYEISCVPIFIGGQSCTLEMIHPNRRVISAVTGASAQSFDVQKYLSGTIGSMIYKDTITGLFNRRYIDEYLPRAVSAACERGQPFSLIFANIDELKPIIDRYDLVAGDLVIQHIAELIKRMIRQANSWVARYGGDEFIICLPGVDNASAIRIANRVRLAVMNERFPLETGSISLTCSIGVHTVDQSDFQLSALMLLHRADEKLYQAKRAGKNKVF